MQCAVSGKIKNPGRAVPAAAADVEGAPGAGRKTDSNCPRERPDSGAVPSEG